MPGTEIRLAGSGGQGLILASIILAEAAVLAGKYVAQTQSYGPEARGGLCKAEVIISDKPIGFTKVTSPDFLLALTQQSLERYTCELPPGCLVMTDESLAIPPWLKGARVFSVPLLRSARESTGKAFTANIVAAGAINSMLGLVPENILRKAVKRHIPKGTEEINFRALEAGTQLLQLQPA